VGRKKRKIPLAFFLQSPRPATLRQLSIRREALRNHTGFSPSPFHDSIAERPDFPLYQQEAIRWLQHFKNTELLQQLLACFEFSEAEIAAYRNCWANWLKPKTEIQSVLGRTQRRELGITDGGSL